MLLRKKDTFNTYAYTSDNLEFTDYVPYMYYVTQMYVKCKILTNSTCPIEDLPLIFHVIISKHKKILNRIFDSCSNPASTHRPTPWPFLKVLNRQFL